MSERLSITIRTAQDIPRALDQVAQYAKAITIAGGKSVSILFQRCMNVLFLLDRSDRSVRSSRSCRSVRWSRSERSELWELSIRSRSRTIRTSRTTRTIRTIQRI